MAKKKLVTAEVKKIKEDYQLPASYDSTNVTLIVRDPQSVNASWDVSSSSIEQLINSTGNNIRDYVFALRMYEVSLIDFNGHNANHWFDIDVG